MLKSLKTLGAVLGVVALIILAFSVFPKMMERSELKRKGFTTEEIEMIEHLKMVEDLTNAYMGRPKIKNSEWSHLTEVYDSDGSTLIGYYIQTAAPGYSPRRYYYDLDKNQVEASNYGHFEEGIDRLRELYHKADSVQ